MAPLADLIGTWPVDRAAAAIVAPTGVVEQFGDPEWSTRVASISKLFAAMAALVAVEEETIALDEVAGPEDSTVRHLLAHASGLLFDEHRTVAEPGRRRIYSNSGIEQLADHIADRSGMPFIDYQRLGVIEPLGMANTELRGSPARDVWSTLGDLSLFAGELLAPSLISLETLAEATRIQFPGLRGVVPGLGSYDPNPWGLGFEIRGEKHPHWTGSRNSPSTFGHFGGSGTFLWVDPAISLAAVGIADRQFGEWSLEVWPTFSDAVIEAFGGSNGA